MRVKLYSKSQINWSAKGTDRVLQNVMNLLKTKMYEVPFLRYMGIDPDLVDKRQQEVEIDLRINVKEMIETYEPRATFIDLTIEGVDGNGDLIYYVEVEV